MVVYKYKMKVSDRFEVKTPRHFKPCFVARQGDSIYLWAEVDPDSPSCVRTFYCVDTGHLVPKEADYIGTVIDDPFVWHFYWKSGLNNDKNIGCRLN